MPLATTYDSRQVTSACVRQWLRVADAVELSSDESFDIVTRLPGWRVAELVAHLVNCVTALADRLAEAVPATIDIDVSRYLLALPSAAEVIGAREVAGARGASPAEQRHQLRAAVTAMAVLLEQPPQDRLVATRFGGMRLVDFIATRCLEGVVHGLDLAHTFPDAGLVPCPDALKVSTKMLLAALATKAPGKAVEVRVPPIAAVQCVEGPRHTRGTPANVVETDPVTWIELATGRLAWTEPRDDGRLRASGERSDLRELLPLL